MTHNDREPTEVWRLDTRHLGRRVEVFAQLDSTNTHALERGTDPANDGLVLLAREQQAGRGQYGRAWQAPAGSSVLMSVLLFPPAALRRPALLTAWAAVAVGEAVLRLTGLQARIKWPNDVLLAGKKVCGILIEQRNTGHAEHPLATVVGIGLNVTQPAERFAEAGLPLAGSLASVSGHVFATDDVARTVIAHLDEEYDRLRQGDTSTLEALWKWRLGVLGRQVMVEAVDREYRGRVRDLTLGGLELAVGAETVLLAPEAVRHVTPLAEA
jgi:BirA family transcriptional regulator, biotin operon repressor / biotin---[acetyl-CoA-carboxylase] ligase